MKTCTFKAGIFVQRPCTNDASGTCSKCATDVCDTHSATLEGKRYCLQCSNSEDHEHDASTESFVTGGTSFNRWYWTTREIYYHTEGRGDPIYDIADYSSFDSESFAEFSGDTDHDDFFDS